MSTIVSQRPPAAAATPPWSALARAHADQMTAGAMPLRVAILGTAGAGKSSLLRHLRESLDAGGQTIVTFRPGDRDLPSDVVVVVDDAHLLPPEDLDAIARRAADAEAGLLIAARSWPRSDPLSEIIELLERSQPSIVLGHIGRDDAREILVSSEFPVSTACIDDLVELSGGIPWLLIESLTVHTRLPAHQDESHASLTEALQDVVSHRLRALDPDLRTAIEARCLLPRGAAPAAGFAEAGHAAGFLTRNGQPAPIVESIVRSTMPVDRLIDMVSSLDHADDGSLIATVQGVHDPRVADALLRYAERLSGEHPRRADEVYRAARDAGADAVVVAVRRSELAWRQEDVDGTCALLEAVEIPEDHPERSRAVDLAASAWAARALVETSVTIYRTVAEHTRETAAHSLIAAIAAGGPDDVAAAVHSPARTIPSTLSVSLDLLGRGLRASLESDATSALHDLVRAAETYSAASHDAPIPELPAVIAAQAAIGAGELDLAESILQSAVDRRHGGAWAHRRLLLWRAWIALQRQRPHEVEQALAFVDAGGPLTPRDRLHADAIRVALARRYSDSAVLTAQWHRSRETLLHAEPDLFTSLQLAEFVEAAARLGDTAHTRAHFERALAHIDALGSPPLWSAHLHWAGIQQGILLNAPGTLTTHARALVAAAPHSRVASRMAHAGRVWTSVLTGTIDVDLVEESARGLASVGLAWDGARLAGHAAGRTDDRRVGARLLACARHLHPRDQEVADPGQNDAPALSEPRSEAVLSAREWEVATLVLQGKTYAEIGETIYISPRTAEHHIARIRRRLGATTRSDLIAKLRLVIEESTDPGHNPSNP